MIRFSKFWFLSSRVLEFSWRSFWVSIHFFYMFDKKILLIILQKVHFSKFFDFFIFFNTINNHLWILLFILQNVHFGKFTFLLHVWQEDFANYTTECLFWQVLDFLFYTLNYHLWTSLWSISSLWFWSLCDFIGSHPLNFQLITVECGIGKVRIIVLKITPV